MINLVFYGDDLTGSTDALDALALRGVRAVLFLEPPDARRLARYRGVQAVGIAGATRAMKAGEMARELRKAFQAVKRIRPRVRQVHYKVCSTFDSSERIGSIGRAIEVGREVFRAPFVAVVGGAPALGRYCVFGNLFARMGIGSKGKIFRLDRHPAMMRHPVTPAMESDLRVLLESQARKGKGNGKGKRKGVSVGLVDFQDLEGGEAAAADALRRELASGAKVVLFDAFTSGHVDVIGKVLRSSRCTYIVGPSSVEHALAPSAVRHAARSALLAPGGRASKREGSRISRRAGGRWSDRGSETGRGTAFASGREFSIQAARPRGGAGTKRLLSSPTAAAGAGSVGAGGGGGRPLTLIAVGSGSVVTKAQVVWAKRRGFVVVELKEGVVEKAVAEIGRGRRVIVRGRSGKELGNAIGMILAASGGAVGRVVFAGGDTSSFAARALGIEALEWVSPLTPGAPLCRAHAPGSPADGIEFVFKGGQVGAENYFEVVS